MDSMERFNQLVAKASYFKRRGWAWLDVAQQANRVLMNELGRTLYLPVPFWELSEKLAAVYR